MSEPPSTQRTPVSVAQHEDFTIAYYEDGRFRLCLDTADPSKLPKFRQAVDCIEAILKLPRRRQERHEIDGDWAE
jgi:hypothetical protein